MSEQFKLIGKLGRGGMAEVLLAVVRGPGGFTKLQVVKRLHAHFEENPEFVSMFLDEARLAAMLSHPNICQTYEVGHEGNNCFMVMEYLEGQPFSAVLKRSAEIGDGLPLTMHLRVLAEVLDALHYAHEKTDFEGKPLGIVHRDISSQNVFALYDAGVKLLDFGIAKAATSTTDTRTGVFKGKVRCLAPEQVLHKGVDRRTDIFQVGLMLFEAVARRPYWPKTLAPVRVVNRLFTRDLPEVQDTDAPDAPDLIAVLRRALAVSLDDRYATAELFRADLEAAITRRGSVVAARDVGARVSRLFEHERKLLRREIEETLRDLPQEAKPVAEMLAAQRGSVAHLDAVPASLATTHDNVIFDIAAIRQVPGASAASGDGRAQKLAPAQRGARARRIWAGSVLAAAVVAALLVWVALRPAGPPAVPTVAGQPSATASAQPAAPGADGTARASAKALERVRIHIQATPARATLWVDGVPQSVNPVVTMVEPEPRPRTVRAEAPGYVAEQTEMAFDRDREISFALKKQPAAALPGRPPGAGKSTPVSTQAPAEPKPTEPSLPIREER